MNFFAPPDLPRALDRLAATRSVEKYARIQQMVREVDVSKSREFQKLFNGYYRVRQKPGPSNALGLVKFVFPNQNDVYLHSTPEQSLFGRARRDFSHGCVRVEDPVALAAWALRQSPEKVRAAIAGEEDDQYVRLERSVRVMIVYSTAAIGENGDVRFFADIYGHDATLAAALRNEHATPSGGLVLAAK